MNGQSVMSNARGVVTSYADLCEWMKAGDTVIVTDHNRKGYCGIIQGIRREDGSGRCWLVDMTCGGIQMTAFIREAL